LALAKNKSPLNKGGGNGFKNAGAVIYGCDGNTKFYIAIRPKL